MIDTLKLCLNFSTVFDRVINIYLKVKLQGVYQLQLTFIVFLEAT